MVKVDTLIIGGDLAGKSLVPIIDLGNEKYQVQDIVVRKESLTEIAKRFKSEGAYFTVVGERGYKELAEYKNALDEEFKRAINERLEEWSKVAEEKLKERNLVIYTNLGNDDPLYMFDIIKTSEKMIKSERKYNKFEWL